MLWQGGVTFSSAEIVWNAVCDVFFDGRQLPDCALVSSAHCPQHGQIKVRSTEEQAEAKRKLRADKLRKYQALRDAIFATVGPEETTQEHPPDCSHIAHGRLKVS